ncbi:hypothetical protein [Calothrix sp. NIES-2098]
MSTPKSQLSTPKSQLSSHDLERTRYHAIAIFFIEDLMSLVKQ